jgi:hypothetical protein
MLFEFALPAAALPCALVAGFLFAPWSCCSFSSSGYDAARDRAQVPAMISGPGNGKM